jgi:hypothetical protein
MPHFAIYKIISRMSIGKTEKADGAMEDYDVLIRMAVCWFRKDRITKAEIIRRMVDRKKRKW